MDEEIKEEMEKFDYMIDEEVARLLVLEKKHQIRRRKIAEIDEGSVALYAKIESFGKKWKNGVMAIIGDETGHCILRLWKHNAKIAEYLEEGDVIKIANGWAKSGAYGLEINVGKFGIIEKVEKKIITNIKFGIREGIFCLKGVLKKKFPTEIYFENEGERFFKKILVDEKEIFLFDERVKEVQRFCEGEEIVLLWLYKKNDKIYATDFSRIMNYSAITS